MYLKSIEVQGFKSFANKILFEFHDGITGIVGPNGSGKSNVADAVRWVLGEQSAKQLRGSKMEDIIFSGTETRKPLGLAYVAITLDNKDHKLPIEYDEVTVARRVYRSGESEYLINGHSCRLKDVQELFLDTGIGKEGYSIIGQGQIDKILSGKPEDRRELFDEAAGIVKFKKRKAIAGKNLEEEKQNLYRINDILIEIEKQVGPLEKQSSVAKDYLKLKEELKELDVNMFLLEYDRIHDNTGEVNKKLEIATNDLEQTQIEYSSTKEEYDKLEVQIEEFNAELDKNRNILSESKLRKEKLEGEIKVLKEQINTVLQNEEHYKGRVSIIEANIADKQNDLDRYQKEKQSIDEKLKSLGDIQAKASIKLNEILQNIINYTKEIEKCNSEIMESLNGDTNIKTSLQRYETMLEQNNIKKVSLSRQLVKNKSDEASYEDTIRIHSEELNQFSEELNKLNKGNGEIESEIQKIQGVLQGFHQSLNEKQQEYHREQSRLDSLKNITERYEGYGNSIRKVMEHKEKESGIIGVVADIIKVEQTFETAIEIALGGSIQNIVTDNENTAKRLIEYLKKNKYGRATFLPLTSMKNKIPFNHVNALKEKGVIGLASNLITVESRFTDLVEYLLGRVIVVDTIDNAIALSKKYNYSLRIVTKDGEQFNPGGSMSGGAYKNSSNLIGRRREIEELEGTIQKIGKSIKLLELDINNEKENRNKQRDLLESNKKKIQEIYLLQNTAKINLAQAEQKKNEAIASFEAINRESKEIELQMNELKDNITKLNETLQSSASRNKENEIKIEEINQKLEAEKKFEKEYSDQVAGLKMESSSLEQSNQFALDNISRVEKEINKLEEELQEMITSKAKSSQIMDEKKVIIESTEEEITSLNQSVSEIEEVIRQIQKDKEELSRSHKSFFSKREELSERINMLDKESFRLSNQAEKLSEQLDFQINYMWEEYELTYSSCLPLRSDEEISLSQMKKSIGELKNKIRNLGDVNVNAIEDYKNLMERFELLSSQRDDLIKSEEALINIINELDVLMRKQFEEKFHEINKQFDHVFKELFGGGKGTLELMEDEDILEAGIRIIAQPPGKKLQNMMQLSGGEKALTAISLLFAIQNLKPSPFCLLDEIEAALDDSNVKRYAKYLHKLTKDTQFIIITHRRGTMASADVLYGITMQEKGVSTLVSVNLIENELDK
ncbi:condensin subunit Smc [Mobilisporobacter senegalensis]|uniref:Chromosome partition protein Smc n=1 Tax=Mobilisporobacter senegalensis TaxID=1329262 RepID=A0A3N1X6E2_9FIRM|nr:chromosome segregation protein SMC [Mobilisporobacter senegalensis]ROR22364.1 condensin subunit Smc [Mobilisporobacter senegalensis]